MPVEEQQQNSEPVLGPKESFDDVVKFAWGPERDMQGNIINPKVERPTDVDSFFYDESFSDYDPGIPGKEHEEARTIDLQIQIDTSTELGKIIAKYFEELANDDNSLERNDKTGGTAEAPGPNERE